MDKGTERVVDLVAQKLTKDEAEAMNTLLDKLRS